MRPLSIRPVTWRAGAATAGVLLLAGLLPVAVQAATEPGKAADVTARARHRPADYDSRATPPAGAAARSSAALRRKLVAEPSAGAVRKLHDQLGVQGIVDIDGSTGTPRRVARLDGFLTGPSRQRPERIARTYVAKHADAFGLDAAAVAGLTLRKDYVDVAGTHHLSFVQAVDGVPVFGNGLKAHVAKDGRLIQLDGSPLKRLPASAGAAKITADGARTAAVKDVSGTSKAKVTKTGGGPTRETTFSDGGNARLVLFQAGGGARLGWETVSVDEGYVHVVDAGNGQVLYRQSTVDFDSADVFPNYPGAPRGGTQETVSLTKWLPDNAPRLDGNVAHVFSDVNADDQPSPDEEVGPSGRKSFRYPFVDFSAKVGGHCSAAYKCSWDLQTPNSWKTNREQNAVQMYYFLGVYHDHLAAAPIGFTRKAGNFEAVDGDAVKAVSDNGANLAGGLPDANHVDDANMTTPPDGTPPLMRMYLFAPDDTFIAGNSGDDPSVLFHEYTHGLSNRLIVDANGNSTLGDVQAGAMGEAWSDWYALDLLVKKGFTRDSAKVGDLMAAEYLTAGATIRSEPSDCTVGAPAAVCPGTGAAGPGGYTYGDYGKISPRGVEAHQDGEIWAQTLWDLREKVGSEMAESLVTRAMELSPANPSFLDERNSILAADLVVNHGRLRTTIWQVFAARGMGYFAAAVDGNDPQPVEDFSMPPSANGPKGSLTGTVTDPDTGGPAAGVIVGFGGHQSGLVGPLQATTAPDGTYTISGIQPATYAKVFAGGPGYDNASATVTIPASKVTKDWAVRRNWAASSGGATVVSFTGPDYTWATCGPNKIIDQAFPAWKSEVAPNGQSITLRLSGRVDITQLTIDPSAAAACYDDETASTAGYRVETSPDGTAWTPAASGTFPAGTATATTVPLTAGRDGVQFIRYTMLTSQAQAAGRCPSDAVGCQALDSSELTVHGTSR